MIPDRGLQGMGRKFSTGIVRPEKNASQEAHSGQAETKLRKMLTFDPSKTTACQKIWSS
jgi:hypothetical protein